MKNYNDINDKIDKLAQGTLSDNEIKTFYEQLKSKPSLLAEIKQFRENFIFLKNFFKRSPSPKDLSINLFKKIENYELEKHYQNLQSGKIGKDDETNMLLGLAGMAEAFGITEKAKEYYEKAAQFGRGD